jgi:hypothetical protein
MPNLVILVVFLELAVDAWGVIVGIHDPARLTAPGGAVRALAMGTLAYLFIVKDRRWARVSFAAIQYVTGITALALGVTSIRAGRAQLDIPMVTLVCGYLVAGLIVTFARPRTGRASEAPGHRGDVGAGGEMHAAAEQGDAADEAWPTSELRS